MICARYTNATYKVSEVDGSIVWTLGGFNSSFEMDTDFNFSRQHDARFLESGDGFEVISFLDNGGDDYGRQTSLHSSAVIVKLNKSATHMKAYLLKRWIRPHGR